MATKRAGIDPTAANVLDVSKIDLGTRGPESTAQMWGEIGKVAADLRAAAQPMANDRARKKAGQRALAGDYRTRWGLNEETTAYNNAIEAAYVAKTQNDIDVRIGQIEIEHGEDVEGYASATEAVRATLLEQTPAQYAVAVSNYATDRITSGGLRVAQRRQATMVKQGEAAIRSRLEVLDAQHSEMLPNDPQWQAYMLQRESIQSGLRNPLYGVTDEELDADSLSVISRAQANAIGQTALAMYDDAEDKAEGAADAIAFLDQEYRRTDLFLTPAQRDQHMGEGRRRIQQQETARRAAEREVRAEHRALVTELTADVRDEKENLDTLIEAHQMPDAARVAAYVRAAEQTGRPTLINHAREIEAKVAAVSALRGLTGARVTEQMAAWSVAAEAGDVSAARRYNEGARYLNETQAQMRTKPLEFFRDWTSTPLSRIDSVEGWRGRIAQGRTAALQAGNVAPQFLLPGEKSSLAALSDRGGDEAFQVAAQIVMAGSREDARAIFAEIGPNGPALGYAGMVLVDTGDRDAARRILLGQQQLRRVGAGGDGGYRAADLKPADRDTVFNSSVSTGLTGAQRADRRRAADLLFEGQYSETGDSSKAAYERAVASVNGAVTVNGAQFGGVAVVRGARVQVPSWMRASRVDQIVQWSLNPDDWINASGTGVGPVLRSPGGRIGPATYQQLRQFHLTPVGAPGRYRLTTRSTPDANGEWEWVKDANGAPYVLDLNKIRGSLAARFPEDVMPERPDGR